MRHRRATAALLLAAALLAGCGTTDGTDEEPSAPPGSGPTSAEPTATSPDPTDPATTEPATSEPGDLPGEPVEGGFPLEGAELGAVGVVAGDVLHLRAGPGTEHDSVAELEPLATGLVASGHNRQLDDGSLWAEVTVEGTTGWVNTAFVSHPGPVTDVTAELGEPPTAATLEQLAVAVAHVLAGPEPTVTIADGPREGDLGEVVVDVLGFADDAVAGERLHVLAAPTDGGWTVRTVEATLLCARGVSEGLCA